MFARWFRPDRKRAIASENKKEVLQMPTQPRPHFGDPEELGIQQKKPYRFGRSSAANGMNSQREKHLQ